VTSANARNAILGHLVGPDGRGDPDHGDRDRLAHRPGRLRVDQLDLQLAQEVRKLGAVETLELPQKLAPVLQPAGGVVSAHQVDSRKRAVKLGVVERTDQVDQRLEVAGVAQVTRQHHEGVPGVGRLGRHIPVEREGFVETAGLELASGDPELRPPGAGLLGDLVHRLQVLLLAAAFAMDRAPPLEGVVLVGIDLERVTQRRVRLLPVATLEVDLGQVGQDHARLGVLLEALAKGGFGLVETAGLHLDDGHHDGRALPVVVELTQTLGGLHDVLGKAVAQGHDDLVVEPLGVVPVGLQGSGEDLLDPLLTRDADPPTTGVEGLDHLVAHGFPPR
jgi:hypothetical protein